MKVNSSTLVNISLAALLLFTQFALASVATTVEDQSVETFYKDGTYTHFINSLSAGHTFQTSCDPSNSKLTIYATMVLRSHPDFASKIVDDFATLDSCQQQTICKSLIASNHHNEVKAINEKYNEACFMSGNEPVDIITNVTFLDKIESYEDQRIQLEKIDHCWAAFFATGDEKYILKMMEYTKQYESNSEHAQIISEFLSSSSVLAQLDPAINEIMVKNSFNCLSCFR